MSFAQALKTAVGAGRVERVQGRRWSEVLREGDGKPIIAVVGIDPLVLREGTLPTAKPEAAEVYAVFAGEARQEPADSIVFVRVSSSRWTTDATEFEKRPFPSRDQLVHLIARTVEEPYPGSRLLPARRLPLWKVRPADRLDPALHVPTPWPDSWKSSFRIPVVIAGATALFVTAVGTGLQQVGFQALRPDEFLGVLWLSSAVTFAFLLFPTRRPEKAQMESAAANEPDASAPDVPDGDQQPQSAQSKQPGAVEVEHLVERRWLGPWVSFVACFCAPSLLALLHGEPSTLRPHLYTEVWAQSAPFLALLHAIFAGLTGLLNSIWLLLCSAVLQPRRRGAASEQQENPQETLRRLYGDAPFGWRPDRMTQVHVVAQLAAMQAILLAAVFWNEKPAVTEFAMRYPAVFTAGIVLTSLGSVAWLAAMHGWTVHVVRRLSQADIWNDTCEACGTHDKGVRLICSSCKSLQWADLAQIDERWVSGWTPVWPAAVFLARYRFQLLGLTLTVVALGLFSYASSLRAEHSRALAKAEAAKQVALELVRDTRAVILSHETVFDLAADDGEHCEGEDCEEIPKYAASKVPIHDATSQYMEVSWRSAQVVDDLLDLYCAPWDLDGLRDATDRTRPPLLHQGDLLYARQNACLWLAEDGIGRLDHEFVAYLRAHAAQDTASRRQAAKCFNKRAFRFLCALSVLTRAPDLDKHPYSSCYEQFGRKEATPRADINLDCVVDGNCKKSTGGPFGAELADPDPDPEWAARCPVVDFATKPNEKWLANLYEPDKHPTQAVTHACQEIKTLDCATARQQKLCPGSSVVQSAPVCDVPEPATEPTEPTEQDKPAPPPALEEEGEEPQELREPEVEAPAVPAPVPKGAPPSVPE